MTRRFNFDLDEPALRNVVLALEQRAEFCAAWLEEYPPGDDAELKRVGEAMRAELRDHLTLLRMWGRMLDGPAPAARAGMSGRAH